MVEQPYDERYDNLGKRIWQRVVRITSFTETQNRKVYGASCREERDRELMGLWGDLQTLFRGGVFPEDMVKYEDPDAEDCE